MSPFHGEVPSRPTAQPPSFSDLPRPRHLLELLEGPCRDYPDVMALCLLHQGREREALTWSDLWRGATRQAARLRDAGLGPGGRVMIVLPTGREFVDAFFGSLLAGGTPVPVSPPASLRGEELSAHQELLSRIAADCEPAVCVSQARMLHVIRGSLDATRPGLRFLKSESGEHPSDVQFARPRPTDTALLQYTSGSTSRPKGVVLSHRNILANIRGIAELLFHPNAMIFSWLPLYHDMGLIGTLLTAFYGRAPAVFMPPQAFIKDPASWLRGISTYRATITVAPNFAFNYCVRNLELAELADVRLDSLRVALNGAEPVDPAAVRRFEEKFHVLGLRPGVVRPVYGLAESSLAVTFAEPGSLVTDGVEAERLELDGRAVPAGHSVRRRTLISVGPPIPGQEVRIVDPSDKPLPERRVGEIVVRGDSVMESYHGRERETAKTLRGGWLHTGDLGYQAAGELFVTGRSKDMLIRRGRNYYPQDIEFQVTRIEGVRKGGVAAFAVEAQEAERVVVVAETRQKEPQALTRMEREIRERVHQAFLFGPDEVLLVAPGRIPRTTSGKVRRQECRRRYLEGELVGRQQLSYGALLRSLARSWWTLVRRWVTRESVPRRAPSANRSLGTPE